jgi:hypothetical protein
VWLLKTTPILFAWNDFTANLQKGFELARAGRRTLTPRTGTNSIAANGHGWQNARTFFLVI